MYKAIAWELGLPTQRSRASAYRAIQAETTRLVCETKQLPVLVIDEAQHLRNDVLEDVWPAPVFHRIDTRSGEPPPGLDRAPCTSVST